MEYPATTATVETLPNGLTLILDPDPSAPVVSAQIWVGTGSMHEDQHLGAGISHFLEHMVFKGTRDCDAEKLANRVQAAGGHWNAYTSFDRTVYYIDGPADSLPIFLSTLTGLVFFPTLPESEFEKEKDVIRREIDMGLDNPDNIASQQLFSTAFTLDPRRHPVIGHRHLFDAIRHEDLTAYHRTRYAPDRCFVVISGDFDATATRQLLTELTKDSLPACGREPNVAIDPPQLGPRQARDTFAIPSSRICLAWKTPALDHPDAPAFDVLASILGNGNASRLHRQLRDDLELALEISAFSWNCPGRDGLLAVSADADPAKRDELITAICAEISAIATCELDEELAKTKRQIAASQFRGLTTASGRAADLASNWHEARDLDFTRRYLAATQAVTPADIRRAAATLTDERLCITILDPLDAPAPPRRVKSAPTQGEIQVHTFPNGMTLALLPDHRLPLVHLQAAVRAGLTSETAGTNGLNQLLASTLSKGTATRSAAQIALSLESLGASIGANTGNNAILIQAAGLAPDLATITEIFAEVILAPSLPSDAIGREKASQLATLEETLQDPLHTGFRELRHAVFSGGGYGLNSLGSAEALPALVREELAAHHSRHFNAANLTLAISGDFEPATVLKLIEEKFASLPPGQPWVAPASIITHGGEHVFRLPKKQAILTIGFPGAAVTSADRHALAMIQEYASDMAGPLFTRIREELGLAYQVGANQFLGFDTGLFTFYVATSPEQVDLARKELLLEIEKIATHGIPDETFERVRSTVLSSLAIQQQSSSVNARQVALSIMYGFSAEEHRKLPAAYKALTAAQVREVATRIFSASPTIVTVLPEDGSE
jgi:zinc protease